MTTRPDIPTADVGRQPSAAGSQRAAVLAGFEAFDAKARRQREQKLRRILRDDGATHHAGATTERTAQAWDLDLLPAVLEAERWGPIEAGVAERAQLYDFLLKDLYGKRTLLRDGVLPPELVLGYPGFLRAADGIWFPGPHQLVLHAVDLVERSDGIFCALADRPPHGLGYALENRTALSRVAPKLFRTANVLRLSSFFTRLRTTLLGLAGEIDDPNAVLLSAGPVDETYFEQAYLANYLGMPLVQGGDLFVRHGKVWMKALDGLTRIDVIFRFIPDLACDPVELHSDSLLGVPGLLGVARDGGVRIVNPIGTGVLANPGLHRYLPAVARHFLGRDPLLPTVPTWWCGDPDDLAFVEANVEQLLVLPLDPRHDDRPALVPLRLAAADRAELLLRIRDRPDAFAAQQLPEQAPSTAFTGGDGVTLTRAFSVGAGEDYEVMPGALTRLVATPTGKLKPETWVSQDTWIVTPEPAPQPPSPFRDRHGRFKLAFRAPLPSRVVENLFWMGRYSERAHTSLRLLRTVFLALNGPDPLPPEARRALLGAATAIMGPNPDAGSDRDPAALDDPDPELLAMVLDGKRPGSIRATLASMLTAAEDTKELLSSDTLRVINDIEDANDGLEAALTGGLASAPEEALDPLVTALLAMAGLAHESMIRGVGWRFMEIGRRLERSVQLIRLCRTLLVQRLPDGDEEEVLQALFLTLEMLITYRRRYRGQVELPQGFELLLIDVSNPRSLLFQFEQLSTHLDDLPRRGIETRELLPEQRSILEAITTLRLQSLVALGRTDASGQRVELGKLLDRLRDLMLGVGTAVSEHYFEHRPDVQRLVPTVWDGE